MILVGWSNPEDIGSNCNNKLFLQPDYVILFIYSNKFKSTRCLIASPKFHVTKTEINLRLDIACFVFLFVFSFFFSTSRDKTVYSGFRAVAIYETRTVLEATYSECGKGTKRSNETVTKICMNCTNESLHVTEKKWYIYMKNIYITKW